MSEVVRLRTRAEIDEQAASWVWRLDAGPLAADQQRAYEAWLRQGPRHRRSMEELSRVWVALDQLAESGLTDPHLAVEPESSRQAFPGQRHLWWVAAAAALTAAVIGVVWLQPGSESQVYSTTLVNQGQVEVRSAPPAAAIPAHTDPRR
ncbi:MAG TPA: DUF4880 domain-containing protein [Steroidobacteraceae bacterium]|jgi:ferric-dicitrate binding protein FerR (iron transport regulator)|nr:DUF4880 domain-containing protein [Steroidobacteraceae bacterium]